MDDREGEFALGEVLAEAFVLRVVGAVQVHVVVADLEDEADEVDEGDAVSGGLIRSGARRGERKGGRRGWLGGEGKGSAYFVLVLSACMSLTARRKRPPVLLLTISR